MEVDLGSLLWALFRRRGLILLSMLGFFLGSLGVSFVLPSRYKATAKILPPMEDEILPGRAILAGLGQEFGLGLGMMGVRGMPTTLDIFLAILKSNTILDRVIEGYGLIEAYGVEKKGDAARMLRRGTEFRLEPEGVVAVSVESRSPELSARGANAYIAELDRFVKETNMTRGRNTRIFVERRLEDVKADLAAAEESLKVYQQRHGLEILGQDVAHAVELYASLKAQALAKEVELDEMRSYTTADNPLYHSTLRELSELNARLNQMPPLAMEYARRLRDLKIQEELYALLIQQYEQAKILEARDTPTVVILEEARPPSTPSWPKKKLFVGLFTVLGLVVGVLIAAGDQFLENLKQQPDEYENLRRIGQSLKRDLQFWSRRKMR